MTVQTIIEFLTANKRLMLIIAGCFIGFLLIMFIFDRCSQYLIDRESNQDKQAINAIMDNANTEKQVLNNLAINEAIRQAEVNRAKGDLSNAQGETNNARNKTNDALKGVNAILGKDYNGKTLPEANTARCKAFPSSCQ